MIGKLALCEGRSEDEYVIANDYEEAGRTGVKHRERENSSGVKVSASVWKVEMLGQALVDEEIEYAPVRP